MIKNLIFDLDNTIIKDEPEDALSYKDVLIKFGYPGDEYMEIYDSVDRYPKDFSEENNYYNSIEMCDFINKDLNKNYSYELVEKLIESVGLYWNKKVFIEEDIINKLSSKYNLYVYTNYFKSAQEKRLEKIGYLKYFKKVFAADYYGSKPFKSSFEKVLKEINAISEECIMIGDDKANDILAANNMGMKSILFDYNGRRDKKEIEAKDYIVIKDMKELEKILL